MSDDQITDQRGDRVPDEEENRNAPLIDLLHHSLHRPLSLSKADERQIIAQVWDRLERTNAGSQRPEAPPISQLGEPKPVIVARMGSQRRSLPRWAWDFVAVLLVGALVGASYLVFRSSPIQRASHIPTAAIEPSAQTQVDGLKASMYLATPGPYFLSELLVVDLSLANLTDTPIQLLGSSKPDTACFMSALSVEITSGGTPSYTLPTLDIGCLDYMPGTKLAPNKMLTLRQYLPVTLSGIVTIAMGGMKNLPQVSPLDGHWPVLSIQVDSQIPPGKTLSLHDQAVDVMIQAPPDARSSLLYRQTITCNGYVAGGPVDWSSHATLLLTPPACPTTPAHWKYLVSAPGYAIVAGSRDV